MALSIYVLAALIAGAITIGITLAFIFWNSTKKWAASRQSNYAKELKAQKELEFLKINIQQLNKHLQLETTPVAKLLDSFNIDMNQMNNFVISKKAEKQSLTEKNKKQAVKFKI